MKLLAVLHSPPGSGGDTTIRRIAGHLTERGHVVFFAPDTGDPARLEQTAREHGADALIGTHALSCGWSFPKTGLPYVVVFGGTDLNEYAFDPETYAVMTAAVDGAAALVAFTDNFMHRCLTLWPHVEDKLWQIPQGVRTLPPTSFSLAGRLGVDEGDRVLLLPAGLRPIKDPMMLFRCVIEWHAEDPRVHLAIAGSSYDEDYEDLIRRRCATSPALHLLGALSPADLQTAMRQSAAVLNTSLSECSPNALLEAMRLRRPVLARNIPGNTCIVHHELTGLTFSDAADFRRQAQRVLDDELYADRLTCHALAYVNRVHSMERECAAYGGLLDRLAESGSPARTAMANAE
jgi:glycosyltransferase involved in cell wall biosynthesis